MSIYQKKVSVGNFLKKETDFKEGSVLEIANEGKEVPGNYGMQNIFLVKAGDKEGNVAFNQTTINGLIDAYGPDSVKWIGKQVKAVKVKANVAGKFIDVWYFSHPDAELTEDGFILPVNRKPVSEGEIDEINVEDIPF